MRNLGEIVRVFLKLGIIGFGGPAAHIAMMESEVVSRRKWMSREHFLDLLGATNLIPGPNSTEMAIHAGFHRGGWAGLILAGVCFIFPAVTLTGLLAWAYVRFGDVPEVEPFLYGIKPAVIVVILNAVWKLGKKALKGWKLTIIGAAVLLLSLGGINEVLAIFAGGLTGMIWLRLSQRSNGSSGSGSSLSYLMLTRGADGTWWKDIWYALAAGGSAAGAAASHVSLGKLFLVFLKVGAVLFGSGYVLVAFLEGELVLSRQWLTQQQLLDAIAIGQFTPGPVLSTATFIGYVIAGLPGALLATLGIFLPSFLLVAMVNPLVPKLRRSPWLAAFLDAVNVSAVGLMAAVTFKLGYDTLINWRAGVIFLAAALVAFRWPRVSAVWLVLGGALLGYLLNLLGG